MKVVRGDTKDFTIVWKYESSGLPFDLTDKTVFFTVKKKVDTVENDATALIAKTFTTGTTDGISAFSLTTTDTMLAPGIYTYYSRVTTSNYSQVLSTTNGVFEVVQGTTTSI